jgi:hypothetical protein
VSLNSEEAEHESPLFFEARLGSFAPYGALYSDANLVTIEFPEVASGGPAAEVELGTRFAGHFALYGSFEYAALGIGDSATWRAAHGAQTSARTDVAGLGLRWLRRPHEIGLAAELGLGYRWFAASWADGTTLKLGGGGDVHIGVGASFAIAANVTLSPMFTLYSGVFSDRSLAGQPIGASGAAYAATLVSLGGTFDLIDVAGSP